MFRIIHLSVNSRIKQGECKCKARFSSFDLEKNKKIFRFLFSSVFYSFVFVCHVKLQKKFFEVCFCNVTKHEDVQ